MCVSEVVKVARFKDRVALVIRSGDWKDSRGIEKDADFRAVARATWPFVFDRPGSDVTIEVAGELVETVPAVHAPLRQVRVTYANGDVCETSMAAKLSDDAIRNYFRIGREFNLGRGDADNMQAVVAVEILR